jgi:hypothetical protein
MSAAMRMIDVMVSWSYVLLGQVVIDKTTKLAGEQTSEH